MCMLSHWRLEQRLHIGLRVLGRAVLPRRRDMHMYMHMYMYIYIYIRCVFIYTEYIYSHMYTYVCIYVHVYIFIKNIYVSTIAVECSCIYDSCRLLMLLRGDWQGQQQDVAKLLQLLEVRLPDLRAFGLPSCKPLEPREGEPRQSNKAH